jgi:integrase
MKCTDRQRGPVVDRSGVYHYRRRVPEDIRFLLRQIENANPGIGAQDKREEKKSLGRDKATAGRLWQQHDEKVEARWAELRSGRKPHLTIVEREALAGDIYRLWLSRLPKDHPSSGMNSAMFRGMMEEHDGDIPRWSSDRSTPEEFLQSMHGNDVDRVLAERGIRVSEAARWGLLEAAQRAAKQATRYAMQRIKGDLGPDPEVSRFPNWPNEAVDTLTGLHKEWVKETPDAKPDTHAAFGACIRKFVAFLGHDVVADIGPGDVKRWLKFLKVERRLSDIRIRDGYFAAIRTVLNCARKAGSIATNVCDTVKLDAKPRPRTREKDLRQDEVYAILKASLETHEHAGSDVAAARRWVPWLLAYTGARVAEITRLESRHIIEEAGVFGIDIQQSKNGRPRIVPIHRDLKKQGFLRFVAERENQPLFFSKDKLRGPKLSIHKTRAEGLGEWARGVAKIAAHEVAPNHGWRHRFKTECRRINMDREVRFYLQGHAFKVDGEEYGYFPLDVTAAWMELFPTYDVSGESLTIHRVSGNDIIGQAVALLHMQRGRTVSEAA